VLARKLNLAAGDTLRLEVHGRVLPVRIAALVNDYMQGGLVAFLDRDAAARSISLAPAEFFMVWARPGADVDALSAALGQRLADEGVVLQSFLELRRRLDVLVDAVVGALWSLLALGFLVGAAAVSNTLTLNVLEQTRELGLLRIIGMTPRQVRRLVFCEALLLGLLGALLGTAGGITTAVLIHWCNEPVIGRSIPFALPGWLLAANVGGCLAIALAAAWRPARRAARLNALAAIAYE
jgi:putative ABC transport system permease protein